MAKIKLTLTCRCCGKTFIHEHFCNNRASADNYEEWAKGNVDTCPECYKASMVAKREQEAQAAISGIDMVHLNGTEKQVAWANTIRAEAVASVMKLKPNDKFFKMVNSKTEAKWWIDHRGEMTGPRSFLTALSKT